MNPRKRRRCTIDDPAFKGKSSQLSDSITGRLIVQAVGCLALKCISSINVITSESVEWYHCCWTIRIYIKSFRLSPCEARRRVARVRHGLFFVFFFFFFFFLLCIKNDINTWKMKKKNRGYRENYYYYGSNSSLLFLTRFFIDTIQRVNYRHWFLSTDACCSMLCFLKKLFQGCGF